LLSLSKEFGRAIEEQLDFKLEAERNRQFRRNFARNPIVRFPALIEPLCTESVLTMEYMEDLIRVEDLQCLTSNRETLAVYGLRAFYQMIFNDGLVHGDMHPGNVFFNGKGELVILDTGLVAQLDEATRENFTDFFFGMVTRNGQKCAQIIYESATYRTPDCDANGFRAHVAEIVNRHADKNAREFEVTSFAADLFVAQRRYGIRGATDFIMTIISLLVFEGIMKQIHPELDFQDEARRFILKTKYGLRPPRSANNVIVDSIVVK
jgi:ubiquinone biosynthesis protein